MIKEALRGGATLMEKIMTNEEAQFLNDIERRLAELEEAQLLHEQEIYDARAEFDDLAAAMGWSKRDLVNGIGPMDYARNLKARAEAAEAKLAKLGAQEPIAFRWRWASDENAVWTYCHTERLQGAIAAFGDMATFELVYSRPAPAVSLTEMVPETWNGGWVITEFDAGYQTGWDAFRAEILRRINGVQK